MNWRSVSLLLFLWLPLRLQAVEPKESERGPSAESMLEQVVELRLLDARERGQWRQRERELKDLTALYRAESERNQEELVRLREHHAELEQNVEDSVTARDALNASLHGLVGFLEAWESSLAQQVPLLPEGEQRELEAALMRDHSPSAAGISGPLVNRMKRLALQLQWLQEFHSQIHLHPQVISLPTAGRMEVQVLYAGLSLAWFVNRSQTHAGYGYPMQGHWHWVELPDTARAIASLQAGYQDATLAAWVTVPLPKWKEVNP